MTGLYQHAPELNFELRIIFNCVFYFSPAAFRNAAALSEPGS